jgi:hypothetical protein
LEKSRLGVPFLFRSILPTCLPLTVDAGPLNGWKILMVARLKD